MEIGPTQRNTLPLKIGAGILVLLIFIGVTMYVKTSREAKLENNIDVNSNLPANSQEVQAAFKNGTYTATGSYTSPSGQADITVTLTIANGMITSVDTQAKAPSPTSKFYQEEFINNYKPLVIGKSISDLKLGKVAGSSLTSKGFNDAVDKIKTQARS